MKYNRPSQWLVFNHSIKNNNNKIISEDEIKSAKIREEEFIK